MTDTELLDWFDVNGVESGFAVSTPDGEAVIVSGDSIRDMLMTAMALRGPKYNLHEANRLVN
jgi:hypothetical protein